ncbi:MAG: autotransporter domain-containing protein, partial [Alphaproteobacteria bacterium]|nr:autotransporter domain-containing protein [Alphaproteobacteria bacterium]
ITLGLGGNEYNITSTIKNTWGIYTGYIGSTQENKNINIDEQGGYFGLYNNFNINKINIKTTLNTGAMDNAIKTSTDTDDFTNFWIGGAARLSYDLKLDKTLTFTPEIFAGYTWIKSNNYTSTTGESIKNTSANYFEFTPAINLIKNVGNNWFGILSVKYIIHNNSNQTTVNNIKLNNLDTGNYFEYTLTINKQFGNLDLGINIGRHDGDRYGWLGGAKIKYLF